MGKYKVEVCYTVSYVHTFEVEAADSSEAIDKAEQEAADYNFKDASSNGGEYEGTIMESPEDRNECPDCGSPLKVEMIEGVGKHLHEGPKHCTNDECGWEE